MSPNSEAEIEKLRGEVNASAAKMEGKMDLLLESVKAALADSRTDFANLRTDFSNLKVWVLTTLIGLISSAIVIAIKLP